MAIGPAWPIPIHRHCRCRQRIIAPGRDAPNAFADFRKILDEMPDKEKIAAVGKSVYQLLDRGVVEWKDAVSKYSVRPLKQVVALTKIDVATMEAAGVRSKIAEAAYKSVHTAEQVLIRQHRQELLEKLTQAGVHQDELVRAISTGLTERATIVGGFGTQSSAIFAAKSHAAALAAILARFRPPPPGAPPGPTGCRSRRNRRRRRHLRRRNRRLLRRSHRNHRLRHRRHRHRPNDSAARRPSRPTARSRSARTSGRSRFGRASRRWGRLTRNGKDQLKRRRWLRWHPKRWSVHATSIRPDKRGGLIQAGRKRANRENIRPQDDGNGGRLVGGGA